MSSFVPLLIAIVIAYLIGATPTAVVVSQRIAHLDIRKEGSGNPGASNVYRILGPQWAMVTFGVDVFKGYLPVYLADKYAEVLVHSQLAPTPFAVMAWAGFAAFLGHVFSPFLRFRGGKGASTALGAMFAMTPQATTMTILVYAIALFIGKTFSIATLSAALAFPIFLFFREGGRDLTALWGIALPVLLLITHRKNVIRILRGQELAMHNKEEEGEQ